MGQGSDLGGLVADIRAMPFLLLLGASGLFLGGLTSAQTVLARVDLLFPTSPEIFDDVNADGVSDILLANPLRVVSGSDFSVIHNFSQYQYVRMISDLDGDGAGEFLVLINLPQTPGYPVLVLRSGDLMVIHDLGLRGPFAVIKDVSGDGRRDIIFSSILPLTPSVLGTELMDGSTFAIIQTYPQLFSGNESAAGDVNGNGTMDVFVGRQVYEGLTNQVIDLGHSGEPLLRGIGDVDGDGFGDVAIADANYPEDCLNLGVFLGGPVPHQSYPPGTIGLGILNNAPLPNGTSFGIHPLGDLDGDGKDEWILHYSYPVNPGFGHGGGISVMKGFSTFNYEVAFALTGESESSSIFGVRTRKGTDFNHDGLPDFVVSGGVNGNYYFKLVASIPSVATKLELFQGCQGPSEFTPILTSNYPILGSQTNLDMFLLTPSACGYLIYGTRAGTPQAFGSDCSFLLDPLLTIGVLPFATSSFGHARISFLLPHDPACKGAEVDLQAFAWQPTEQHWESTNGLFLRLGFGIPVIAYPWIP